MKAKDRADQFALLWNRFGPDGFPLEREHRFAPPRRWRFDFAYVPARVAIEIEGVVFAGAGRHQSATGMAADCEKYNQAIELGWRVLRYTQIDLRQRPIEVIEQIERVLSGGTL